MRVGRLSAGAGRRHPVTIRNGGVDEAGMSTTAPSRHTVL